MSVKSGVAAGRSSFRWSRTAPVMALAMVLAACGAVDEEGLTRSYGAGLEASAPDDMPALPETAGKDQGCTTSGVVTSIVVPILLIPQGSSVTSVQVDTLTQALGNVRRWYHRALPNDNVRWDTLKIMYGNQTAAHYLTNNNVWAEMPGEIQQKLGWNPWDAGDNRHIALVIGRDLLGWAGGNGYNDGRGLAILGLESLADQARCAGNWWCTQEIWHGTAIHELGHGFSLPHDSDPLSIMSFHGDFTNKYFVPGHASTVEVSPATEAKQANWSYCGADFQCATKRCGGNWSGDRLWCLPSTAYPKEAANIPNGYTCRQGTQCISGFCELTSDGDRVCVNGPLPQYVTPFFPYLAFYFSAAGSMNGKLCVQIHEAADPHTWMDNYLCSTGPHELQWSSAGPIPNMRCTQINEPAEPAEHTWNDNYICVPHWSPLQLQWSYAGPISGKSCIRFHEAADPHTWGDNYLCY